ncbi:hypothetical protein MTO96_017383 [Rhipicephalus appendiculatus]
MFVSLVKGSVAFRAAFESTLGRIEKGRSCPRSGRENWEKEESEDRKDDGEGASTSGQGPRFVREPPSRLRFHNSTGGSVECSARGHPTPELRWLALDDTGVVPGTPALDLPGLRRVRADGSLEFLPFRADEYRQDVHSATYRCLASNRIGVIGSRDVHVPCR